MSARRFALDAFTEWEETSRFASEILSDISTEQSLSSADRALTQEILFGTIRNLYLLDEVIDRLRKGRIKQQTQNLLRIGLYQLLKTEIAEHAAINETVEIARKHERGLVNAILRTAQRQREELKADIATWSLEDRFSHPQFFIDRWTAEHGEDAAAALCEWNNRPPDVYARINSLHPDKDALNRVRSETRPCSVGEKFPDFFKIDGPPNYDWIRDGLIYIQDPSTSLACRLLDPKAGETVLDACAAPGGKTALMSAMMGGEGKILATDSSDQRLDQMRENLERLHVPNVETRNVDWTTEDSDLPQFDAILLDVPCSNTGVMRRRVDVRWRLQPGDFKRQAAVQSQLLSSVAKRLSPGGRLVYSTCSVDREENEAVVEASGLTVETIVRSLPWQDSFDGAFAALLRA